MSAQDAGPTLRNLILELEHDCFECQRPIQLLPQVDDALSAVGVLDLEQLWSYKSSEFVITCGACGFEVRMVVHTAPKLWFEFTRDVPQDAPCDRPTRRRFLAGALRSAGERRHLIVPGAPSRSITAEDIRGIHEVVGRTVKEVVAREDDKTLIVTLVLGAAAGIAAGFLKEIGVDAYKALKEKLNERRDQRRRSISGDVICEIIGSVQMSGGPVEVVVESRVDRIDLLLRMDSSADELTRLVREHLGTSAPAKQRITQVRLRVSDEAPAFLVLEVRYSETGTSQAGIT